MATLRARLSALERLAAAADVPRSFSFEQLVRLSLDLEPGAPAHVLKHGERGIVEMIVEAWEHGEPVGEGAAC